LARIPVVTGASNIAPHLDAGVLELNEQRRLPRGVAREAMGEDVLDGAIEVLPM
jgi:hypothetical protein